jgi:hypothetical protein
MPGANNPLLIAIRNTLAFNTVVIHYNKGNSYKIVQTNGEIQEDPLSPLLFNVTTADIVKEIQDQDFPVTLYMYADDMLITCKFSWESVALAF